MIRKIMNWLGFHICWEFTKWDDHTSVATRPATMMEASASGATKIQYVKRWQERKCTECGRIYQRTLGYGAISHGENNS